MKNIFNNYKIRLLNFCDDRNKALKKNKDYVEKADKIIQQTNDLNIPSVDHHELLYLGCGDPCNPKRV